MSARLPQARKIIRLEECSLNLQAGFRGNQPVVACGLVFFDGGTSTAPVQFLQIDRLMKSLGDANAFVEAANESVAHQIRDDILASDGHIVDAVNRVFGASTQQAAARFHQLMGNRQRK